MRIRKLDTAEHNKCRGLYEDVFSEDSKAFVDYYYTEKTKDNQIYVVEEDGAIRSMLHLNPYKLYVNGQEKTAHYIVAVATLEEYRKQGYMGALLKEALNDMQAAGEAFTFLMPAAEPIYLPYDFRTVYRQHRRMYAPGEDLSTDMTVEEAKEKDVKDMAVLADTYLKEHFQVFALRDERYYERLLKEYRSDGGKIMLYKENGAVVDMKPYMPGQVEEEAPKIMTRIVDLKRMLMSLSLRSLTAVSFQVTDPVIEENNKCVVLTGTEFSGVMLMDGPVKNSEGMITIAALTSLIFGAKTVEEVCAEDGVHMTARMQEEMKKIIPLSRLYLNEIV